MINKEIRELLAEIAPEAVIFDNPSFDNSIIGLSDTDGIVYDYDLMVEELAEDDNMSSEEAMEYIDYNYIGYNTVRAIPYMHSEGNAPIIVYRGLFE